MKLHIGERLLGTGPAHQPGGYLVTDVVRETPWYGLYAGKKVLYNFDFTSKRVRETDDKEWLDVYLRTLHYPRLDDPGDVAQRRSLARSEVAILGNRGSNLWPEPIDLLEIENTRDAFTFAPDADDREPIAVFARPHGQPLGDWQQAAVPVASLLSVLAELFEFVRRAHGEGLLLQGLGPAAILIDRADRVHYIGSDMVAEQKELGRIRRLFPHERFPRGFAAPEFFDAAQSPSPRSDLYAWGALAYFLFTGHMPWQIALEQGRPWAEFQPVHFERLEAALRQIPPAHVEAWAEQLGLPGAALVQNWPGNCVAALRWLLHPEPMRRPATAEELRSWMIALPPAQVNAVLALEVGNGETRIYLDIHTLETGAEIAIRRGIGQAPQQHEHGELVFAGPPQAVVVDSQAPLTEEAVFYTVFTRKAVAGGAVYSGGVATQVIEPIADQLLAIADAEAATAMHDQLPPRMALCFRAMDATGLSEILQQSPRARVRGWALRRAQELSAEKPTDQALALLHRFLIDADDDLRRTAFRLVWQVTPDHGDEALVTLMQEMGKGQLEDAIDAAHKVRGDPIADEQWQRVIERLEGERPTTCPLCGVPLPRRQRVEHLRETHDYVDVDGSMMPRRQAEARLWDRVFAAGDARAHQQLVQLFGGGDATRDGYVRALENQLLQRLPSDRADGANTKQWELWLACIRQAPVAQPASAWLLRSTTDRIRAVGRALLLPELAQTLRGDRIHEADIRRALEAAAPGHDLLRERIRLCEGLAEVGVDEAKAESVRLLLQDELPVACPECAAQVRAADLELHLRRAHAICQFRGVRRSATEMRDVLLTCVCGARPDVPAWRALYGLALDRHASDAVERLAMWLCRTIKLQERGQRDQVVGAAADAIARTEAGKEMAAMLLSGRAQPAWKNVARQLALEIIARLEEPLPDSLWAGARPYLAAKDIPSETRQHAVAGLLRACGCLKPRAWEVLESYVSATGKQRAVERLRALEQRIGQSPVLDEFLRGIEDRVRMTCPRCQGQFERRKMIGHLWEQHRLMLDGRQVREPWRVLADWVVDYGLEKDSALLQRCRELALKADPAEGEARLQRLLLRQGIEDRDAWNSLTARARDRGASLCPHCFAQVAPLGAAPPLPLSGTDWLEGHGYRIQISDMGLRPHLQIETPVALLYDGPEPGAAVTRWGALLSLTVPIVLAAFGVLYALFGSDLSLPLLLVVAFSLSLFLGGLVYLAWPQRSLLRRLLAAGWEVLVPELLAKPLDGTGIAFLGSLAAASAGQYLPDEEVLEEAEQAMQRASASDPALPPLLRLREAHVAAHDEDAVPHLAERFGQALAGTLTLRVVAPLLAELPERWPQGRLLRLRTLACARAVDAGLEDAELAELVRAQPALRTFFGGADHEHLKKLQSFWALRARWMDRLHDADSVFDLAQDRAAEKTLADRPDLLIMSRVAPIYVGTRGVWLKDACLTEKPDQVAVVQSRWQHGDGYEIVAGSQRVWFSKNPGVIADELEQWLQFYFTDFLPQLAKARPPRASATKLWRANATRCPECHRLVVPIAGELGVRVPDVEAQLAS